MTKRVEIIVAVAIMCVIAVGGWFASRDEYQGIFKKSAKFSGEEILNSTLETNNMIPREDASYIVDWRTHHITVVSDEEK